MDLLAKRYADPCFLLNGYIKTSRFCEFINATFEEVDEDMTWEFFLHKVWDKNYSEFKENLQVSQDLMSMSGEQVEATVQRSMDILGNFNPDDD